MAQTGRTGRLHPAVGAARGETARVLNRLLGVGAVSASGKITRPSTPPLLLAGVSGGPDSLALASLLAHFVRRGEVRAGAVIVDHNLQPGSAQVAERAAAQCRALGLEPVEIVNVQVHSSQEGPEKAAQLARYRAFAEVSAKTGASGVLLGHTLDDQAETVLLGLARGSGTRSLAGMPEIVEHEGFTAVRPLLGIRRTDIEKICAAEGLDPWYDPTNHDQTLMRAKVRHRILPFLEEHLGGDVAESLSRTAQIAGADADYLHTKIIPAFEKITLDLNTLPTSAPGLADKPATTKLQISAEITQKADLTLALDRGALTALHPALRRRVLAHALTQAGGHSTGYERLNALDRFAATPDKAGPLQMPGHIAVYKVRPPVQNSDGKSLSKSGVLVFLHSQ